MQLVDRAALVVRRDHTLGTIMERLAKANGTRALVEEADGGLRLSYQQAAKRVRRWAGGVAAKASPGDRVVIATPNGYEMLLLCLAASRAGAIPVPVNPQMRPEEVRHVIADSGAALTIHHATQVDGAEPLAEAHPADPGAVAALFYTSGTTGKPKGVELTHRALVGQMAAAGGLPPGLLRGEAVVALPIAHIMGFGVMIGLACAGVPVYFLPKFRPPDVLDAIERRRARLFVGVPAMYRMMLEAGAADRDLSSVRVWVAGADAMPTELAHQFKKFGASVTVPLLGRSLGEALFVEGYGMVEIGGGAAVKASPPLLPFGLGESLGFPVPGYRFRVIDDDGNDVTSGQVGELWLKGPGVTKGYWGDENATSAALTDDGWLRTGDLARKGLLGSVVFAGRKKDVIKHGGYSVYAIEVERALEEHPDVLEAAVLGLPDERKGEIPVAAVRLADGASIDGPGLVAWAKEHLSDYKAPQQVVVVEDLPRTGTRKVQKRELLSFFVGSGAYMAPEPTKNEGEG